MIRRMVTACLAVSAVFAFRAAAQEAQSQPAATSQPAGLQAQNEELRRQNQEMQEQMRQMQARMDSFEKSLSEKLDKADAQQQARAALKDLMDKQPPTEQWVSTLTSKTKLVIYGFLRGEAEHDTRRVQGGYAGFFVLKDDPVLGKRSETNFTARNTRLGFNLTMPEYNQIQTTGKLEMDFGTAAGIDTAELSPNIRLRHAYLQAKTPAATFLAGQTWDVFAPLYPYTDNVAILWDAGNVGYRRPQFRIEKEIQCNASNKFLGQFALARAVGGDSTIDALTADTQDDGSAADWPDLQARGAYSTKLLTQKDTTFGLSGIYGHRKVRASAGAVGEQDRYAATGLAGDATIPLCEKLTFRGEIYAGQGLGGYFGNIGQYYDPTKQAPVRGMGGWGELDYELNKEMTVRGGWGADCVDPDSLSSASEREFNMVPFINYSYKITPNLVWTVEYEYLRTRYFDTDPAVDDHRVSTSFTLNF